MKVPSRPTKQTRVSPKPDLIPWDTTAALDSDERMNGWFILTTPSLHNERVCQPLDRDRGTMPRFPVHGLSAPTQHSLHARQELGWAGRAPLPPRVAGAWSQAEQVCSLSNGGHRSTRILIRENNNLSKIYMICVCFLDGISMGLIHQAGGLAGDPGRKARREKHVMTRAPAEGWEPTWPAKATGSSAGPWRALKLTLSWGSLDSRLGRVPEEPGGE